MAEYLHGFGSDHGPIFLFSENSLPPRGVRTIRIKEYFGKTDAGTANYMAKKIMDKTPGKRLEEEGEKLQFSRRKRAAVSDIIKNIISGLEK